MTAAAMNLSGLRVHALKGKARFAAWADAPLTHEVRLEGTDL